MFVLTRCFEVAFDMKWWAVSLWCCLKGAFAIANDIVAEGVEVELW